MRLRTLARQSLHFTETGSFFHALLGAASVCERYRSSRDANPRPIGQARRAPHPADYIVLGLVSMQERVTRLIDDLASDAHPPPIGPRAPKPRTGVLR